MRNLWSKIRLLSILLIGSIVLSACTPFCLPDLSRGPGVGITESEATVTDSGFTVQLDGVSISGDSGVAPAGTTVRASLATQELPTEIGEFAEPVGTGLEITLDENRQPASPLTITFAAEEVSNWKPNPDTTGEQFLIVFTSRPEEPGMEFADAQQLADGSVVVTADHLSWFQPAYVSLDKFSSWFGDQVLVFAQVRSPRPDCVDQSAEDLGWQFSTIPNQYLWPCLADTSIGLEATFANNSPEVWLIQTDQAIPELPNPGSATGIAFATGVRLTIDTSTTAPVIPPSGSATFLVDEEDDQIVFDASLSPAFTVANSFWSVFSLFIPGKYLQLVSRADCFSDIVPASMGGPADSGAIFGAITRCVGNEIKGLGSHLLSALGAIPGAVTANIAGAVQSATGNDRFLITLSKITPTPVVPTATAMPTAVWPINRHEGPYLWLGANMWDYPDWSACDDSAIYCLIGYTGEEHVLLQMDGHVVIGTIPDSVPDPRQALLSLGLSDTIVDQLLRP